MIVAQHGPPLVPVRSSFQIVGDVRLDSPERLLAVLGPALKQDAASDLELCLLAYLRWGNRMLDHIDGEYALAIIDIDSRAVFMARDVMGTRPLFYIEDGRHLVVGSNLTVLRAMAPDAGSVINVPLLRGFLELLPRFPDWRTQTAFADIQRLPPGQCATANPGPLQSASHAELLPDSGGCRNSDDYVERFGALFSQAIRSRLRGVRRPAILVSGGQDSSAIACQMFADRQPGGPIPHLYSWVFPLGHGADERSYLEAVVEQCAPSPVVTLRGEFCFGIEADHGSRAMLAPETFPNPVLFERMAMRAVADGADAVFTGEWGDEVVQAAGFEMPHVFGELSFTRALADLADYRRFNHVGRLWLEQAARPLLDRYRRRRDRTQGNDVPATVNGFTARRVWSNVRGGRGCLRTTRLNRFEEVTGVAWQTPFLDRRLVSHLLAVPAEERLRYGRTKHLMRRAMTGILPEQVRMRTAPANCDQINDSGIQRDAGIITSLLLAGRLVDLGILSAARRDALLAGLHNPAQRVRNWKSILLRSVHVELWLAGSGR